MTREQRIDQIEKGLSEVRLRSTGHYEVPAEALIKVQNDMMWLCHTLRKQLFALNEIKSRNEDGYTAMLIAKAEREDLPQFDKKSPEQ